MKKAKREVESIKSNKDNQLKILVLILFIVLVVFLFRTISFIDNEAGSAETYSVKIAEIEYGDEIYKYDQSNETISNVKHSLDITNRNLSKNEESIYRLKHKNTDNRPYFELVELILDPYSLREPIIEYSDYNNQITGRFLPLTLLSIDVDGNGDTDYLTTTNVNGNFSLDLIDQPLDTNSIIVKEHRIDNKDTGFVSEIKFVDEAIRISGNIPNSSEIIVVKPDNTSQTIKVADGRFELNFNEKDSSEGVYNIIAKDTHGRVIDRVTKEVLKDANGESTNTLIQRFSNKFKGVLDWFNFSKESETKYVEKVQIQDLKDSSAAVINIHDRTVQPRQSHKKLAIKFNDTHGIHHNLIAKKASNNLWFLNYTPDGVSINHQTGRVKMGSALPQIEADSLTVDAYTDSLEYVQIYPCYDDVCTFDELDDEVLIKSKQLVFEGNKAFFWAFLGVVVLGACLMFLNAGNLAIYWGFTGIFLIRLFINIARTYHDIRVAAYVPLSVTELFIIPLFFAILVAYKNNKQVIKHSAKMGYTVLAVLGVWCLFNFNEHINYQLNSIRYATAYKLQPFPFDVLNIIRSSYFHNIIFVFILFLFLFAAPKITRIVNRIDFLKYKKSSVSMTKISLLVLFTLSLFFTVYGVQFYAIASILLMLLIIAQPSFVNEGSSETGTEVNMRTDIHGAIQTNMHNNTEISEVDHNLSSDTDNPKTKYNNSKWRQILKVLMLAFIIFLFGFNLKNEYGSVLFILCFMISVFYIGQQIKPLNFRMVGLGFVFSTVIFTVVLMGYAGSNTTHIKIFTGLFVLVLILCNLYMALPRYRIKPSTIFENQFFLMQLSGLFCIVVVVGLLTLKGIVLSHTVNNIPDIDSDFTEFEVKPIPPCFKDFCPLNTAISPALIKADLWESNGTGSNKNDDVNNINELREQSLRDFSDGRAILNQNMRMRLYGWLVGQPYNAVLWPGTMARIESLERVRASAVPKSDNLIFGDATIADRFLFEEKHLSGADYEHAIGYYFIKPHGIFGLALLFGSFCMVFRGLPSTNFSARVFVLSLALISLWIGLQTQGIFPALGVNAPFTVSSSFLKDIFSLTIILITCIVFSNSKTSEVSATRKELKDETI